MMGLRHYEGVQLIFFSTKNRSKLYEIFELFYPFDFRFLQRELKRNKIYEKDLILRSVDEARTHCY